MTIPALFKSTAEDYPEIVSQYYREGNSDFKSVTYGELYRRVGVLAAGLETAGVSEGSRIGLICDNRPEWLTLDLAILSLGAADVPRGSDTMAGELLYILDFSECAVAVMENIRLLEKILPYEEELPFLQKIILIDMPETLPETNWEILSYDQVMQKGRDKGGKAYLDRLIEEGRGEERATLIYTSGTTGEPKGVPLSHENFLHQVRFIHTQADIAVGDIWLSVLPVWHSLERIVQYLVLGAANAVAYSRPVGDIMLRDLADLNPQWMASVPRIWAGIEGSVLSKIRSEGRLSWGLFRFFLGTAKFHQHMANRLAGRIADYKRKFLLPRYLIFPVLWLLLWPIRMLGDRLIFSKIRVKLGTRFQAGISGGGGLPPRLFSFFQAMKITLLEGYGLTETAPVVCFSPQHHPVMGTVGKPYPADTEIKVVDEENRICPPGKAGLIMIRGKQVMAGYFQKPEFTEQVLDREGWFNSGDLGMKTIRGELTILGRIKDTIVLMGGENVEPLPMEIKLNESPYIEQSMIVGQDRKYLGALIVPDFDRLEQFAREENLAYVSRDLLIENVEVLELINEEISRLISAKTGFRPFERIFRFALLSEPFRMGRELSAKQEIKRHEVERLYKKQIESLF